MSRIAGINHMPAILHRISAAMALDFSPAPARRFTLGTLRFVPIAFALIGMVLDSGSASASINSLVENPDRTHLHADAGQIILASAAPGAVSAIPRSRPSQPEEAAEAPEIGTPGPAVTSTVTPTVTPKAKPKVKPDIAAARQPGSTRAASTAATEIPRPVPRPEILARRAAATPSQIQAAAPAPAGISTPGTLQSALPDSTSLLGVLETSAGREALLRTASGQVVKVTRGNVVEGWQVSSIDRNAIRLTKGSETRMLWMLSN